MTAFRYYVAKGLQINAESVGVKLIDYGELIDPTPPDRRSAEEITNDIMKRAGLRMGGEQI